MTDAILWPILILGAYLIGAIPFGYLIARARGIDIREHGSRNIGATNVGRVLGKKYGRLCLILDMAKGALPVLIAGWITGLLGAPSISAAQSWLWLAVVAATVLGHIFPIYLRFKGGKGVATGFGALAAMWPALTLSALAALLIWIITVKATRFVSIASCAAAVSLPITVALARLLGWPARSDAITPIQHLADGWPFLIITGALAALVLWRHRSNLARVLNGTEARTDAPHTPGAPPDPDPTPGSAPGSNPGSDPSVR